MYTPSQRNYGCRISEFSFKGLRTVVMENEVLRVGILVDKGTDIFEFIYKPLDIDCMWRSRVSIRGWQPSYTNVPSKKGPFLDYYFGGWQELFPNTDEECIVKGAELSLHGEACMLSWDYRIDTNEPDVIEVCFSVETIRTPFRLEKTLVLKAKQPYLEFREKITNIGNERMDFIWGLHPALGKPFLKEGCTITIPECEIHSDPMISSEFSRIGIDQVSRWPIAQGIEGNPIDLSFVPNETIECNDRVEIRDIIDGWYAVTNPDLGLTFSLVWDKGVFPHLLYWGSFCGWKGYPFYGTAYTLAIEPRSSFPFPLTRAIENGKQLSLEGGDTLETTYQAFFAPTKGKILSVSTKGILTEG
jgi:hypothetical protein